MKKERKRLVFAMLIGFISTVVMIFFSNITLFENIEHKITDFKFAVRGGDEKQIGNSDIVIVAIDDQSFANIPYKYPWPRTYHAKLVDNLKRAGAKVIVYDVVFSEKSKIDPSQDGKFRDSIAKANNVVLAGKMVVQDRAGYNMLSLLPPIKEFRDFATFGVADTKFDTDGFVRRYILFRDYNGKRYFSLGLQAIISWLELKGDYKNWFVETDKGDFNIANRYNIKKYDDLPSSLINYYGPAYTFKTISFEQVVDEDGFKLLLERDVFKDKIVLVGATVSELHDQFSTPFYISGNETLTSGVEIHANFIQNVLDQNFIFSVDSYLIYITTILFALIAAYLIRKTKPVVEILVTVLIAGCYFLINIILFTKANILMNFFTPIGALALSFVGCNTYQYFAEEKEKLHIRSVFKHYLAENVVESVLKDTDALSFGGKKKHLTVLFSDIRSFTTYSEKYAPEEVVNILGEYLTEMVNVILQYNGMLDKFVGDEVMAVFGAPAYYTDHAEKACYTALDMMRTLDRLKEKWNEEGRDSFDIGIGINTGDMIVGNLGSKQIFDYTVIGDAVNLGARLEGVNKIYKTAKNIIISEYTKNEIGNDLITRKLDLVRVKGKVKPVAIFELIGEKDVITYPQSFLEHYNNGLDAYTNREWDLAMGEFKKGLLHMDDEVSRMYIRRCGHSKKYPPGKDWDGVFTLKTK